MRLQKYPTYVESNALWLSSIPMHWETASLGSIISRRKERNRPDLPLLSVLREKGIVPRSLLNAEENHNYIPDDLSNYRVALAGDLVVNKMKAWQGSVGIAPIDGVVSPAYFVFSLKGITKGFAHCLLRSRLYADYFARASDGVRVGQWDLSIDQMKRILVLLPSHSEQDQIVAYLRVQDAHIARFIKAKRELIALMAEQRGVLAERAIASSETQHLRLDRVVSLLVTPIIREPEVTYTPIGMFNRGRGIFHKPPTEGKHLGDSTFFRIEKGDLIFSGQFAWEGAVAVASAEDDGCIASHRYPIAKCKRNAVTPEYLYTFFLSKAGDLILNHHSRGAAGRNRPLNPRSLLKEKVPVPPLHLQREVSDFYYEELAVRREIEKEIALIREYRDRLIADVVTGQIDVRGWQPGPEDVVDDAALAALGDENEEVTEEEDDDGED